MAGDLTTRAPLDVGDRVRTRQSITDVNGNHYRTGTEGTVVHIDQHDSGARTFTVNIGYDDDLGYNRTLRAPRTFFDHLIPDMSDREAVEEWLNT